MRRSCSSRAATSPRSTRGRNDGPPADETGVAARAAGRRAGGRRRDVRRDGGRRRGSRGGRCRGAGLDRRRDVYGQAADRAVQPLAGRLVGTRGSVRAAQAARCAEVHPAGRRPVDLPVARREPARALRAEQRAAVRARRRA
ncbi:hypothetical protein EMIT0111MI5_70322 [Burkholderia sp. IT-111MI5]